MTRLAHVKHGPCTPPVAVRELATLSADGARLHVEVQGPLEDTAAPVVAPVHGWTCTTAYWAARIRDLMAEWDEWEEAGA